MKTSKTRIERKMQRKTNPELVSTILRAKKLTAWTEVANLVSVPRRKQSSINLEDIDANTKEGDTVLVPGKVLGQGNVGKKIRVVAMRFSQEARKKLKDKKCEVVSIKEEIKINPKLEGVKILRS